jgi:glutaconate CoA-transferase, subunit B
LDCFGQTRVDGFFLSAGEIDGAANLNLVSIMLARRYAFAVVGAGYLYYVVPKLILFRTEHSCRRLVPTLPFVTASSEPEKCHHLRPIALVTSACSHWTVRDRDFTDERAPRPQLRIIEHTGFDFDRPDHVRMTIRPSLADLELIR